MLQKRRAKKRLTRLVCVSWKIWRAALVRERRKSGAGLRMLAGALNVRN
jgi:hypothetical protein